MNIQLNSYNVDMKFELYVWHMGGRQSLERCLMRVKEIIIGK